MRIKPLPTHLINQIAAGEVIERPASVLKELLENSLDAQATHIEIEVEKGGIKHICISDNGCGINHEDLNLALSPHATSKLQRQEDLFNIHTLGFRGEALASIGSVSRLKLISSQNLAQGAWGVSMEGQSKGEVEPMPHPAGTTVSVQDLFFNLPARRKFLRSEKTEFLQLEETFRRIALSHFKVSFRLKHNQKVLYHLPSATDRLLQEKRIAKVFGKTFLQHAMYLEFEISGIKLWGWLGLTTHTRSQADLQYVYLNGRMLKDKLVNHAIRQAYADKVYPGRYPLFLLYLELDPSTVDVNVHPTKHEVRFHHSRMVYDFILHHVKSTLNQQEPASSLATPTPMHYTAAILPTVQIKEPELNYQASAFSALGWLHGKYWLAQQAQGLVLLDIEQVALLFHFAKLSSARVATKPLLMPVVKSIPENTVHLFESLQAHLAKLGLQLSSLSPTQIALRAIPADFLPLNAEQLLSEICKAQLMPHAGLEDVMLWLAKASSKAVNIQQLEPERLILSINSLQELAIQLELKPLGVATLDDLAKLLRQSKPACLS